MTTGRVWVVSWVGHVGWVIVGFSDKNACKEVSKYFTFLRIGASFKSLVTTIPKSFSSVTFCNLFPFTLNMSWQHCWILIILHLSILKSICQYLDDSIRQSRSCCKRKPSSTSVTILLIFVLSANIKRFVKGGHSTTSSVTQMLHDLGWRDVSDRQ